MLLTNFFTAKRCRGRPKKEGNLPKDSITATLITPSLHKQKQSKKCKDTPPPNKPKEKPSEKIPRKKPSKKAKTPRNQKNWAVEPNLSKLKGVVAEWLEKCGRYFDSNGEACSLIVFSNVIGVPHSTLYHYVHCNPKKQRMVGKGVGRVSLVVQEIQEIIAQTIVRRDCSNNGMTPSECIDLVLELNPLLEGHKQAQNKFSRMLLPKYTHLLKKDPVKAQATMMKRTAITIEGQFRWHTTVDSAFEELRRRNAGRCNQTGKTFVEVMHFFILGGDETCMLAFNGIVRIVGARNKKKHELILSDSQVSITMFCTGGDRDSLMRIWRSMGQQKGQPLL